MSTIEKAINKQGGTIQHAVPDNNLQPDRPPEPTEPPVAGRSQVEIDLAMLERHNFVSLSSQRRLINEEYRVIKRKLINNAFDALSNTLFW